MRRISILAFLAVLAACSGEPTTAPEKTPVTPKDSTPVTPTPPQQQEIPVTGTAVPEMASYDKVISDFMKKYSIPGGAFAVMLNGKLIYARGFGYADVENKTLVQPDAQFRVASVSKTITSAAIFQLIEEGKLELDDLAAPLIADLKPAAGATVDPRWDQITIRQLLNHSGGWDRTKPGGFDPIDRNQIAAATVGVPAPASGETLIRYMKGMPLDFDPGERMAYSNFGFIILGAIIERVSGMPYEEFVRTRVLQPVGANRTREGKSRLSEAFPEEVKYYFPGFNVVNAPLVPSVYPGEGLVPVNYAGYYIEASTPSGAWVSSTIDLLRILGGVDGRTSRPDILKPQTIAEMTSKKNGATVCVADACYYAGGWFVRPMGGDAIWWHGGTSPGTTAMLIRSFDGFAMAGLINTRSLTANLETELYNALWSGLNNVTSAPTHDLFTTFR